MGRKQFTSALVVALLATTCTVANAADWGLKEGKAELKSAGPLAFGPDGILFVADTKAAAIFAIDTADQMGDSEKVELNVEALNEKVGELLKSSGQSSKIQDMAVNPSSGNVYLSVFSEGGEPALVRVRANGKLQQVSLKKARFAKVELPNAPEDKLVKRGRRSRNARNDSITDLAYSQGKVLVSGLTQASAPSSVRAIPFPFLTADPGTSVEIYHGAHGRYEDYSAIRTFVPFNIDGEPSLLASYVCTPLVRFPLSSLGKEDKVRGTTIAELGNHNRPLDMIVYKKKGETFLLLANSARGVMKISTKNVGRKEGITEKTGETAGQTYDTISDLKNVVQLDRLNDGHAIVLVEHEGGQQDLQTVPLP